MKNHIKPTLEIPSKVIQQEDTAKPRFLKGFFILRKLKNIFLYADSTLNVNKIQNREICETKSVLDGGV